MKINQYYKQSMTRDQVNNRIKKFICDNKICPFVSSEETIEEIWKYLPIKPQRVTLERVMRVVVKRKLEEFNGIRVEED